MHISSVIKISFCRISFSGHQNKFCACLDSIYGSRVMLVMCKNCSDIHLNQSKTNYQRIQILMDWSSGKWVPGPNVLFVVCCNFLFSKEDRAALWMVESVRLSVCLSHLFNYSHHRIIMKFSGVITNDRRDVHAKGQDQRSRVNVTEVKTQLSRFRTITPVWIHIYDDEMIHKAW